jgi:hypothetical protein
MIPHHEGAIAMCEVLLETTSDPYLLELCGNVTLTQYAEVAWMHQWMANRGHEMYAPCSTDCTAQDEMEMNNGTHDMIQQLGDMEMKDNTQNSIESTKTELPCEDLLSTTFFCHSLGNDSYCKCSDVLAELGECGSLTFLPGVGTININDQCARTCGLCPARQPLFHYVCGAENHGLGGSDMTENGHENHAMNGYEMSMVEDSNNHQGHGIH